MSIFHLSVRAVSRATGRSAVAAAAYRAGAKLLNQRDGLVHDYTTKPVVEAFIVAPADAPAWAQDRSQLWNAVEVCEKRKDAKLAREYELALPDEVAPDERRRLVEAFAQRLIERYGVVVDVALHPPDAQGDQRNHHAHLLTTTRSVGPDGFGPKTRLLDVSSTASVEVEALRELWAGLVNSALAKAQVAERVDHRSHERQGKEIEPTVKMGPAVTAIERRARQAGRAYPAFSPVTARGRLNATILEMRRLTSYVQRGRAFVFAESRKLMQAVRGLASAVQEAVELSARRANGDQVERDRSP